MTIPSQIKSLQHPIIKHCVSLRKESSYRAEKNTFLVMGKKEIQELPSFAKIIFLFTENGDFHELPSCQKHYILTPELFKKITGLVHPEPYVAEVQIPKPPLKRLTRVLVCEQLSDPGNLGTLIRAALAFEFDAIYLLGSTVDPFNDKAVRAAKGALFHMPILSGDWEAFLLFKEKHDLHLYQADLSGTSLHELKPNFPCAIILGNEAKGTSEKTKKNAKAITIAMNPLSESLNVAIAGAVIMYNLSEVCQSAKNI